MRGRIKFINYSKNYAMLTTPNDGDVFMSLNQIDEVDLKKGDYVEFNPQVSYQGLIATDVKKI